MEAKGQKKAQKETKVMARRTQDRHLKKERKNQQNSLDKRERNQTNSTTTNKP